MSLQGVRARASPSLFRAAVPNQQEMYIASTPAISITQPHKSKQSRTIDTQHPTSKQQQQGSNTTYPNTPNRSTRPKSYHPESHAIHPSPAPNKNVQPTPNEANAPISQSQSSHTHAPHLQPNEEYQTPYTYVQHTTSDQVQP